MLNTILATASPSTSAPVVFGKGLRPWGRRFAARGPTDEPQTPWHQSSALAVAWVLQNPNVAAAIVGASRPNQLVDTATAAGVNLTQPYWHGLMTSGPGHGTGPREGGVLQTRP